MHTCIYIHMYIHIYIYEYTFSLLYVNMCVYKKKYIYIHMYLSLSLYVYAFMFQNIRTSRSIHTIRMSTQAHLCSLLQAKKPSITAALSSASVVAAQEVAMGVARRPGWAVTGCCWGIQSESSSLYVRIYVCVLIYIYTSYLSYLC